MLQPQNFQKVIYLADDDQDDRILFLDALNDLKLEVTVEEAEDGNQLLSILYQQVSYIPELLFLDINMPGKNGFQCLEEIRNAQAAFQNIKVIMLSTSSSEQSIDRSYELGADFYAVKPSTYNDLKQLLQGIFTLDWNNFTRDKKRFLLT